VLCADGTTTDLDKTYMLKTDESGRLIYEKTDNGYAFACENGDSLQLKEYKSVGKNYYEPETISVWLHMVKAV
jgi:hypothetical protein